MSARNRIVVQVEGGVVQAIHADRPDELDVTLLDFDVEGVTVDNLTWREDECAYLSPGVPGPMTPDIVEWLTTTERGTP